MLNDNPIRPSEILRVVRRYGWYVVVVSFCFALVALVWAHFQPRLYDSTALIHLDQHSSMTLTIAGASGDQYDLKIQTQIIGLSSPAVIVSTINKLNLASNPLFNPTLSKNMDDRMVRDRMVLLFLSALTISRVPDSELIQVRFRSRNPDLSAIVVNTLVDEYFSQSLKLRYQSTQDIGTFLTERLSDLQSKIQIEQNSLMTKGLKLGIIDLGSSGSNSSGGGSGGGSGIGTSTLVVETSQLLDQRVKAEADLYLAQAESDMLQKSSDALPPADIPGSAELSSLVTSLTAAKSQLAFLTQRYGSSYPGLAQQKAQVQSIENDIQQYRAKLMDSAQHNVTRDQQIVNSLNARIDALQKQSEASTPQIVQYEVLKSQYLSDQALYNTLLSTVGSSEIETGMEAQVLNRFEVAQPPSTPSYPNTRIIIIVGFAAGFLLSVLVVGVLVTLSDTVETVEDIEANLPIPILASVPEYKQELKATASTETIPLVTLLAPRSASTEAYRLLRTSISLMHGNKKSRVIALTSGGPGEGKSTTALNLAVVIATQSKRVLLLDADLRKPTIAQRLHSQITASAGLSRFLSDTTIQPEDCIQPIAEVPGLDIIAVQEIPPFPSELLSQNRIVELLDWARQHYDYVLIDTPPVLLVTDALIIANHCDTLLVVTRIGVAQKRALTRIRQDLAKYPDKQSGIVVNALPFSETYYHGYGNYKKYYGGGYGNYGGYGDGSGYYQSGVGGGSNSSQKGRNKDSR